MNSLTLDARELFQQTRQNEDEIRDTHDQKSWYLRTAPRGNRLQAAVNWPQRVIGVLSNREGDPQINQTKEVAKAGGRARSWLSAFRFGSTDAVDVTVFSKLPNPDIAAFDHFVVSVVQEASKSGIEEWNKIFAYTDFDALPVYISILTLAATEDKSNQLPARRVFVERCRKMLRSMGMADELFDLVQKDTKAAPRREQFLKTAHMVACLEEQTATNDYIKAAIAFEKLGDIRSALACVYRNTRYRLRDGQAKELDEDVRTFDIAEAGIDTMLAVLTATAPIKSNLPSRKAFYRGVRRVLKKRGQLEYGLLDGLK
ncbi:hypothetical protein LF1_29600 [Rubripirellula obstinata]|uniref:Uncharacterized protein n=1 Tax=Rubripirellula obstinata TaxID=406547 RepID=A0A5B1CLL0_9BACT|nr:hypothetical protein [Rubripirellula obstinata]KAA1260420.1 hypothetical protein LF1_29600 [Rubripirellula obstinata]